MKAFSRHLLYRRFGYAEGMRLPRALLEKADGRICAVQPAGAGTVYLMVWEPGEAEIWPSRIDAPVPDPSRVLRFTAAEKPAGLAPADELGGFFVNFEESNRLFFLSTGSDRDSLKDVSTIFSHDNENRFDPFEAYGPVTDLYWDRNLLVVAQQNRVKLFGITIL